MVRKRKDEETKESSMRDCWHCINCKCDSSCGYRCDFTGEVLPHERIMDRTGCSDYLFDPSVVIGSYEKGR